MLNPSRGRLERIRLETHRATLCLKCRAVTGILDLQTREEVNSSLLFLQELMQIR